MKKLTTLCLAGCLAAALATPAGALDYTIDAPEGPDFGKFTSVEVVHTADGGALKNEDISKNAALIPPGFGRRQCGYPEYRNLAHAQPGPGGHGSGRRQRQRGMPIVVPAPL